MEHEDLNTTKESTQEVSPSKKEKEPKGKKPKAALVINIVTGVVIALALIFMIEALYANKHLHNNYFGYAILPVKSDSMKKENGGKDNFKRGDLIFVKILGEDAKRELEIGDVITFKFFDMTDSTEKLNTHRIIQKVTGGYKTQGDGEVDGVKPSEQVSYANVVGVFKGKMVGVGYVGLFTESKPGMFVMIVVPFFLLLAVSVFYFIKNFKAYSKEKTDEAAESAVLLEKDRIRMEILAELEREKKAGGGQDEKEKKE